MQTMPFRGHHNFDSLDFNILLDFAFECNNEPVFEGLLLRRCLFLNNIFDQKVRKKKIKKKVEKGNFFDSYRHSKV